jgi:putative ABC transport system permease protein
VPEIRDVLARLAGRYFLDVKMPGALPVAVSALRPMTVGARAARVDVMQALRSE